MRHSIPPWIGILAVSALAAAAVASAAIFMSRHVERIADKPPGNRVDDAFRQTIRRIGALEEMWRTALEADAERLLKAGLRDSEPSAAGIVQWSWLNPGFADPARAHRRGDGREPRVKPVLERFAKGNPGEWVFRESDVMNGSAWIEQAGHPLAWRHGNDKLAVVFLLDAKGVAEIVRTDLAKRVELAPPSDEPGSLEWIGPNGSAFLTHGKIPPSVRPDEILRHPSRFGDWTLRRFYPVRVVTSYRLPVLLGGLSMAGLLLVGGVAVISWQRKAARLAEQRVSFVNRVSHELRTPLTNLLLNTDLALDALPVSDAKVRRRLGLIREETARLSRIVDNVQTFARLERGNGDTRPGVCDVAKVVTGVRETFAPLFERKSISCEFDCQVAAEIAVDPDALAQILSNLLSNVEKYVGDSATARVGIFQTEGELIVEVEDSGPGVPPSARKRIFLPFERAGSRIDEGATGTGLGLAISRELAEAMGGKLELVDAGGGAKFRLSVPLRERSQA